MRYLLVVVLLLSGCSATKPDYTITSYSLISFKPTIQYSTSDDIVSDSSISLAIKAQRIPREHAVKILDKWFVIEVKTGDEVHIIKFSDFFNGRMGE